MSAHDTGEEGREPPQRMPPVVRAAVAAAVVAALSLALYLLSVRGPALLLDLAHMGARFLCL